MAFVVQKHIFSQLLSSITAFLTIFTSGVWLGWMSAVLPQLADGEIPISMTPSDMSWTVSLIDIGNLFSPIPAGFLMDRFGRLFVLRLGTVAYALASILALTATTPYHLFLARFLAGIGKGIAFTTATLYVGEIAGPKIRGALCGICSVMSLGGTLTSMTIGPYVSFQTLNWILLAIPLLEFILTFFIVESPYYLFIRNKDESASKALARIRDVQQQTVNQAELEVIRKKVNEDMKGPKNFSRLITVRANRKALLMVVTTGVLERAGGISCIFAYASTTLPRSSIWNPQVSVMIFSWLAVVFALIGMSLVDGFGRKPLMIVSTLALSIILATSAVFYYLDEKTTNNITQFDYVPHVGLMLYGVFYAIGAGQVPHTLHCELFPPSVKSQASAVSTMFLGAASFFTTKIYLTVDEFTGVYLMYAIFALSSFVDMLFSIFYLIETKGKTLAEIHVLLCESNSGTESEDRSENVDKEGGSTTNK